MEKRFENEVRGAKCGSAVEGGEEEEEDFRVKVEIKLKVKEERVILPI